MKAVLLDWATMGPDLDVTALKALLPDLEIYDDTDEDQMAERTAGAEIVLGNKVLLSDALFEAAPDMRFIGLTATGTDNVDLEAAKKRGIAVCNIRAYCTQSVAEHVFGCLLDLAHNLGMKVIAEGIEEKEMLQLLEILGCEHGQGYYISRPKSEEDLKQWILNQESIQINGIMPNGN